MPIDVFVPPRISGGTLANPYFADWQPAVAGDDGKVWAWNNALQKYLPTAMSAGVTDHGALTGLPDDDHTQYHNDARGDARYPSLTNYNAHVALATAHGISAFGATLVDDAADSNARTTLGLGTAAVLNVGVAANNIVQLDGTAKLPAVDGSQLTNLPSGVTDHGALTGLGDDDHTQYALLAGRSGGQTLIGGTASANALTLQSTSHATKGKILFGTSAYDEVNNRLGIGNTSPSYRVVIDQLVNVGGGTHRLLDGTMTAIAIGTITGANLAVNPAAASGNYPAAAGLMFSVTKSNTSTADTLLGMSGLVTQSGTGSVTNIYGVDATVSLGGNAAVAAVRGGQFVVNATAGTVTDLFALRVNNGAIGATITRKYGLFMEDITGATSSFALVTNAGLVVFNEGGDAAADVRIEGDADANLFFTKASTDRIGIGNNAPNNKLDVTGTVQCDGLRVDVTPTAETPPATHTAVINFNGTNYKVLCLAV